MSAHMHSVFVLIDVCMCASDSYNCRGSKSECQRRTASREEADWKDGGREKEAENRKRELLWSNLKVRLMLPRGGADIKGRMSS